MKKLIILSFMVGFSLVSQARTLDSSQYQGAIPAFCAVISEDSDTLFDTQEIDVVHAQSLSPFYLNLVNNYLVGYGYFKHSASLKEIQALFSKGGEEQYNDLYIFIRTFKKTGEAHIEVQSYPGDNPVGYVFDTKGALIGENGDDSYSFKTPQGDEYWCPSPSEQ